MIINSSANAANACFVLQQGRYVVITASSAFKETSVPSSLCHAPMSSMTVGGHASYLTVIRERRVVAAVEFGYRYRALIASPHNLGKLYDRNLRSYVSSCRCIQAYIPLLSEVYVFEHTTCIASVSCSI